MAGKPPPSLKSVQPYLMVARQFSQRDPVVAYYAKMYAVQEGLGIGKSDPEAKAFLISVMDDLDRTKQSMKEEEAMTSEVVAQAHIEDAALRLFDFADKEDRASRFHKNMIKAFYTSSHIFTTLRQFGELSEEVESKMKYAKWKAVEIDRCLKSGITPTPGPPGGEEGQEFGAFGDFGGDTNYTPQVGFNVQPPEEEPRIPPGAQQVFPPAPKPVPRPRQNVPQEPQPPPQVPVASFQPEPSPQLSASAVQLGPAEIAQAQKFCKFASSSLDYDDVQGAVEYLGKAMKLLKTGKED